MDEPKQYKYITPEIVKEGSIIIRSTEEDMQKLKEVIEYNRHMEVCREKANELKKLRDTYFPCNMILLGGITALVFVIKDAFVEKTILTIGLLVLYVGAYFVQSLLKDDLNFFLNVLTTASLLFVDLLFVNLLLFNIIICGIYRYKRDKIIEELGYPLFCDLRIDRIRNDKYVVDVKVPVYPEIIKRTMGKSKT